MPPIDANQDDDQDTRGAAEDAEEAALREELIQMLKGADMIDATSEEADGLLAPMDEPNKVKTTVSVEDGMILAEQARAGAVKPDAEADIDKQIDEKPADPASVAAQAAQTAAAPAAADQGDGPEGPAPDGHGGFKVQAPQHHVALRPIGDLDRLAGLGCGQEGGEGHQTVLS